MFCLLSVFCQFFVLFCLHITEYEQIRGGQHFLGPRGVKYLNTGLIVMHILNFQRDLVVMRFIRIELIICSTSKVDRVNFTYTCCT